MNTIADRPQIDPARQRKVVDALSAFLPAPALLYAREDVQPYECDGLSAFRQ
ncbi:MAG: FAD-binding oxidoreductase, partial [Betaproteobacteria bacterium]